MKWRLVFLALSWLVSTALAGMVQNAEYRIDGGPPHTMTASGTDPHPAFTDFDFAGVVDSADLSVGPHWLEVRMQGDNGVWSDWQGEWVRIAGETHLVGAEWFVDIDPGPGKGTPITTPLDGLWDEPEEDLAVTGLKPDTYPVGRHQVSVRAKDSNGDWGIVSAATFYVDEPLHLVAAEWTTKWDLDVAQHAGHVGYPMNAADGQFNQETEEDLIATATTAQLGPLCSLQTVCVRVQDNWGRWSTWRGLIWDNAADRWGFDPDVGWEGAFQKGVQVVPQTPALPSPDDFATATGDALSRLDWSDCAGADRYEVWLWNQGKAVKSLARDLLRSEFVGSIPLTKGRPVRWFVKAVSNLGCSSQGPAEFQDWVILVPGPGDDDGDGMLDDWERRWFGVTSVADPRTDYDGDGFLDWQEFTALTDPTDPQDFLSVPALEIRQNPFVVVVSWKSALGRVYTVNSTTNVTAGWRDLHGGAGTGASMSFTNKTASAIRQYYRVGVDLP